jgi:hypothetical protein
MSRNGVPALTPGTAAKIKWARIADLAAEAAPEMRGPARHRHPPPHNCRQTIPNA